MTMDHLTFISDRNILIFLIQILCILVTAKILAIPLRRAGLPVFPAEMLAGVFLGPTVLGQFFPELFHSIFPPDKFQHFMLDTVGWLGILFVLLVSGMEVNLRSAWIQRKKVAVSAAYSFFLPVLGGIAVAFLIPAPHLLLKDSELFSRILLGTLIGVVAMPVTLRMLKDLKIFHSDFGVLSLSALSLSDLMGWVVVTVILGTLTAVDHGLGIFIREFLLVLGLSVGTLAVAYLGTKKLSIGKMVFLRGASGEGLGFMILMGVVMGILSILIGVHALFGFFLGGLAVGATGIVKESTREKTEAMMESTFVPIFFAGIGLRFHMIQEFDWFLFLIFTLAPLVLRFVGAWVAAKRIHVTPGNISIFALLNTPGGELHVVAAILAYDGGLISQEILVALIFGTLVSSLVSAPLAGMILSRKKRLNIEEYLSIQGILLHPLSSYKDGLLDELAVLAAGLVPLSTGEIRTLVNRREELSSTAMGREMAFPHARVPGLPKPQILIARLKDGVADWESLDGRPPKLVFLLLTPAEPEDLQLGILRTLIQAFESPEMRASLLSKETPESFLHEVIGRVEASQLTGRS